MFCTLSAFYLLFVAQGIIPESLQLLLNTFLYLQMNLYNKVRNFVNNTLFFSYWIALDCMMFDSERCLLYIKSMHIVLYMK